MAASWSAVRRDRHLLPSPLRPRCSRTWQPPRRRLIPLSQPRQFPPSRQCRQHPQPLPNRRHLPLQCRPGRLNQPSRRARPPTDQAGLTDRLTLCATTRLAQTLRGAAPNGLEVWPTRRALTIAQWLGSLADEALLGGIADLPTALDPFAERVLWEQILAASLTGAAS